MPAYHQDHPTLLDRYLKYIGLRMAVRQDYERSDYTGTGRLVFRCFFRWQGKRLQHTLYTGGAWNERCVTPADVVESVCLDYSIIHPDYGDGWESVTGEEDPEVCRKMEAGIEREVARWSRFLGADLFERVFEAQERSDRREEDWWARRRALAARTT